MNKAGGFLAVFGFIVFIFIVTSFGSFYQVDQGERGIVLRNGELIRVADAGLGFKTPLIESVKKISIRDHTVLLDLEAYSFDQQPAEIKVSVTYRVTIDKVDLLYKEYGSLESLETRVISRRTPDALKNVFGKYTASRAIQGREKLGMDTFEAVTKALVGAPVQIVGVQMEEVAFSPAYEKSIEQRMLAQVQIETTQQNKQTEQVQAEIKVIQAKAQADSNREAYQAQADGIRLRGEAEADAIKARAEALATNRNLVDLIAVEKWSGTLPETMVPEATLPFIGVK